MKQIDVEQQGQKLFLRWTWQGRVLQAVLSLLFVAPLAFAALVVVFAPDLILGDIRAEEPREGLFFFSLAILAMAVGVLVGFFKFFRHQRWIIDGKEGVLVGESLSLTGASALGEADLREIEALMLDSPGAFRKNRLGLRLRTGEEEVLFSGYGLHKDLEEVFVCLEQLFRKERYQIQMERGELLRSEQSVGDEG